MATNVATDITSALRAAHHMEAPPLAALRALGVRHDTIAAALGVSRSTVSCWATRSPYGIPAQYEKPLRSLALSAVRHAERAIASTLTNPKARPVDRAAVQAYAQRVAQARELLGVHRD